MAYIHSKRTTTTGKVRDSSWKCDDGLFAFTSQKPTFLSRIDDLHVNIEFSDYMRLYGDLSTTDQYSGIYVISCFPTDVIKKGNINAIPIVNEHTVYVGESSGTSSNTNMLKRISRYRVQLENTIKQKSLTVVHQGAASFANHLMQSTGKYDTADSPMNIAIKNMYFRMAKYAPEWEEPPAVHETVLLRAYNKNHPGVLFNKQMIAY